jgi:hypothetical protein
MAENNDAELLDWLEQQARASSTGISFDWIPSVEGESSGFRFMRRHFIGEPAKSLRDAIARAQFNLTDPMEALGIRPSVPTMDPTWSAGWNACVEQMRKRMDERGLKIAKVPA